VILWNGCETDSLMNASMVLQPMRVQEVLTLGVEIFASTSRTILAPLIDASVCLTSTPVSQRKWKRHHGKLADEGIGGRIQDRTRRGGEEFDTSRIRHHTEGLDQPPPRLRTATLIHESLSDLAEEFPLLDGNTSLGLCCLSMVKYCFDCEHVNGDAILHIKSK